MRRESKAFTCCMACNASTVSSLATQLSQPWNTEHALTKLYSPAVGV